MKWGKANQIQRYRCKQCRKTFSEEQNNPLGDMRIPIEKAELCLQLLLEGNSVRSAVRITGVHQVTILNLLVLVGEKCERLMRERIKGVAVNDVEADEIWGFVGCKNRHKLRKGITDPKLGDAYTWVGIERNTKLILAWHLGERSMVDCEAFTEKLHEATSGQFQLTTDGYRPYENAVSLGSGAPVDLRSQALQSAVKADHLSFGVGEIPTA
jgi:IS1 family transposase